MSRSSTSDWRAQTEPLAALFAVSVMAIAIGVYAGYVTDTLPGTSDRDVTQGALDRVWDEINVAGLYVEGSGELDDLEGETLPEGYWVYLNVTTWDDSASEPAPVAETAYNPAGESPDENTDVEETRDEFRSGGRPDGSQYGSRPIPVKYGPGDVRGGRLHVVAWQD